VSREPSARKMITVLAGVSLISAAALGYIHTVTRERIEENRQERIRSSLYEVLPGAEEFEEAGRDPLVFRGISDGQLMGYAVLARGMGFQGEIVLMAGFDSRVEKVTGVKVLETVETPGLGDRIRADEYLSQYQNLGLGELPGEVDALTGATLSSEAVERIVMRAVEYAESIR